MCTLEGEGVTRKRGVVSASAYRGKRRRLALSRGCGGCDTLGGDCERRRRRENFQRWFRISGRGKGGEETLHRGKGAF